MKQRDTKRNSEVEQSTMKHITILGEGAWGTALASILATNGYEPLIWAYHQDSCDEINTNHTNSRFLKDVSLDHAIRATNNLDHALNHSSVIIIALPTNYIRQTLQPFSTISKKLWIIGSKGLEISRGIVSSQIIHELFPEHSHAVIAGPSFAQDVIKKQPTGLIVASDSVEARLNAINLLKNDYISLHESNDAIGIQYASILKNIYALGMGILKGAGYEDNTCALYLIKALHEMHKIITVHGGKLETIYGLAGLGDFYLTASSLKSKNMRFGYEIGAGKTLSELKKHCETLPEGVMSLEAFSRQLHTYPIMQSIIDCIHKNESTLLLRAII